MFGVWTRETERGRGKKKEASKALHRAYFQREREKNDQEAVKIRLIFTV